MDFEKIKLIIEKAFDNNEDINPNTTGEVKEAINSNCFILLLFVDLTATMRRLEFRKQSQTGNRLEKSNGSKSSKRKVFGVSDRHRQ